MTETCYEDNRDFDGPSYQTAPLTQYSAQNQRLAEDLYARINSSARTKKYKGSYSIFSDSSNDTAAKIVIYEDGKGRVNRALHLRPGVYALIRANGTAGKRNTASLSAAGLLTSFPSSDTIGVAPAHRERFRYLRVDDANLNYCVEMIRICASA